MQTHMACFNMVKYVPEQGITERDLCSSPGEYFYAFFCTFFKTLRHELTSTYTAVNEQSSVIITIP